MAIFAPVDSVGAEVGFGSVVVVFVVAVWAGRPALRDVLIVVGVDEVAEAASAKAFRSDSCHMMGIPSP
jgi:hypothetical protein